MPTDSSHIVQVCTGDAVGDGAALAGRIDRALHRAAIDAGLRLTTAVLLPDPPPASSGSGSSRHWPGWAANALIDRLRPADAVYVHGCLGVAGLFVAAHARLLGKRVIGCDDGAGASPLLAANPEAIAVYDAVHAPSAFAAAVFADLPVPVHVIEGPIDCEPFRPGPRKPPRDPRLVVALGRVLPRHGQERVVRALPPGLSLVLLGAPAEPAHGAVLREAIRQRLAPPDPLHPDARVPRAALPAGDVPASATLAGSTPGAAATAPPDSPAADVRARRGRARAVTALARPGNALHARNPIPDDAHRSGGVSFLDAADGPALRDLLARAGTAVQASTHLDHAGRFVRAPERLGTAVLEALASGAPTLVSDAGCLPELAALPGCRAFRTDAELAALLRRIAAAADATPDATCTQGTRPQRAGADATDADGGSALPGNVDPATSGARLEVELAMHAAVAARCGLLPAGRRLLALLGVGPACAS